MRKPNIDLKVFSERRRKLARSMEGAALILFSNSEKVRNHDVHYPFRQDSNFFYLTGFEEPDSILVFRPGMIPETVMFVRQRDKERETWDGFRYGPEGVEREFLIEKAYPISDFVTQAAILLKDVDKLYYRQFKDTKSDALIQETLQKLKASQGRTGYGYLPIFDSETLLGEERIFKSEYDLECMRTACEITAQGHLAAMRFVKPGVSERQVQAVLAHHFMMKGAAREGYNYIVASGNSATTLHYNFNDQICQSGQLLLIDAGAEFNYFTGDITRTFPVSGKFSEEQAEVYQGVLDVQKRILSLIKPGVQFKDFQEHTVDMLIDLMISLGLLTGRKEDILSSQVYRRYYPHGVSHWLGMDVHDAGLYMVKGQPRAIEPNMCFTVEPGLYIPFDDESAPKKYRGIGVRIEDNIRVVSGGFENLTSSAPKEIEELEKIVGQA